MTIHVWEEQLTHQAAEVKTNSDTFRNYVNSDFQARVEETYRLNHTHQTLDFVLRQREKFGKLQICEMSVWDAVELLDEIVDPSDPDTDLPQIVHALQTAEGIRAARPHEVNAYDFKCSR